MRGERPVITARVESNLAEFNQKLAEYAKLARKTPEDVLRKQGPKLAYAISDRLRLKTPPKGAIKGGILASLRGRARGIYVRASVKKSVAEKYGLRSDSISKRLLIGRGKKGAGTAVVGGKRLNLQALRVRAELGLREKGRGYLGLAARIPQATITGMAPGKFQKLFGRYRTQLSEVGLEIVQDGGALSFIFPGTANIDGNSPAEGMEKNMDAIAAGIADVTADIKEYTDRKMAEAAARSGL
jgi:hypothetical protein